jgi:hypothetical protein
VRWQQYEVNVEQPGVERPLLPQPTAHILGPIFWKADLLYYAEGPDAGARIWTVRTGRAKRSTPTIASSDPSSAGTDGRISPSGRWLAYTVNVTDSRVPYTALFVRPWPSGARRSQIALQGSCPRWRADGAELFFMAPNGHLMAASVKDDGAIGQPVSLCPTEALATSGLAGDAFDAAQDGQRFLVKVPARRQSIVVISGWSTPSGR